MEHVLTINNLNKKYGNVQAVRNLSLQIEKGSVFGILGPNGSGKTTTLGIALGVIKPTSGSFEWFGKPLNKAALLRVGAILEQPNIYPYLSAVNNLKITADIKHTKYDRIDEVLQLVDLYDRRNDQYKNFSLGMKQRLAIASALINNPEVLVLDEPTNGLDPQGIAYVRELINKIAQQGTTILLASHLLDEVEKVCTHVAVLKRGETLLTGSVADVLSANASVELAADDENKLMEALIKLAYLTAPKKNQSKKITATLTDKNITGARINSDLYQSGVILSHLQIKKQSLESYFLEVTQK
ncbi:MAG: ABC transporter ATP-binding protein [Bacteroidia bacterium]